MGGPFKGGECSWVTSARASSDAPSHMQKHCHIVVFGIDSKWGMISLDQYLDQQLSRGRLILRPEDRVAGAPNPVRWLDPLMSYLGLDYRISLLRAAAQAVMVFQVIVPKQLRALDIGRHRLQRPSPKPTCPIGSGK